MIDAGHGGKDPGCHGDLYKEKDVALAVALKLGKFIEDNFKDVKVIFTRKTDVFVELNERAAIANRNHADLFICVHCNSACTLNKKTHKETCNQDAHGAETYVMGIQKDAGNLEVSKRENQSVLMEGDYKKNYDGFDPNSDEANIIFSFYQNVFKNQSSSLAAKIQQCYKEKAGRNDKGVKEAPFLVLWRTAMPSLLTEIGYLTNHKEEKFLGSENGQKYMASSIFRAFRMYKNEVEGTSIKYNDAFEKMDAYSEEKDSSLINEKKEIKQTEKSDTEGAVKPLPKEEVNVKTPDTGKKDSSKDDKYLGGKEVVSASPVVNDDAKKESNENPPAKDEVVYKVIFYAAEKKIPETDAKFAGVEKVACYEEGGRFKYTSGECKKLTDASKIQSDLRKMGFKDAFVVSFKDGKRVK